MPPQTDPGTTQPDPARDLLTGLTGVDQAVKALAHDAYWQSPDPQTFQTKIGALNIPKEVKAKLWDAKYPPHGPGTAPAPRTPVSSPSASTFDDRHPVLAAGKDLAMGAVHGATGTVQSLAAPIRRAAGMPPATPPGAETSIAGSIGKGVEQIGEFLVPETLIAKYGKTISMAAHLQSMGLAPQAARILGVLPKAVLHAIGAYGVATAQGDEHPKTTAAVAGVLPVAGKVGEVLAPRIMKSALGEVSSKILKRYKTDTQQIAQTLLDYGVNVTKRGLDRLESVMDVTEDQLQKVIGGLKGTIDPAKVAARTLDTAKEFGQQVNPATDLKTIQNATDEFMHHPVHGQPTIVGTKQVPSGVLDSRGQMIMHDEPVYETQTGPLTGQDAQDLKRGTYKQLKGKYLKLGSAQVESEKALARGLREEIEGLADRPQNAGTSGSKVKALNDQERQIMAALEATGERIAKLEKPISAGSVQYAIRWAVKHPYSALSAVARLEGAPIRSIVARVLTSDSPLVNGSSILVRSAVHALVSGGRADDGGPGDSATGPGPGASPGTSTGPGSGSGSGPTAAP